MTEIEDLVHRADLDGLVRLVDTFCAAADWAALFELRNRSRRRHDRPPAVAGSDARRVPAGAVGAGRMGRTRARRGERPVHDRTADRGRRAASSIQRPAAHLPDGPRVGFIAHECALRGQSIATGGNPLEIPFELQPWEPQYALAEYSDEGVAAEAPPLPRAAQFMVMPVAAGCEHLDDAEVNLPCVS